jgi:hypothetical protein
MSEKKKFIIQVVFFAIYISMTLIFFFGWNKLMYTDDRPNDFVAVITLIYFGGGALALPTAWFIFTLYRGLKDKLPREASEPSYLVFANRYLFPAACFVVMISSATFINGFPESGEFTAPTHVYFYILSAAVLALAPMIDFVYKRTRQVKPLLLLFTLLCCALVLWSLDLLISVEFREAMLFEIPFLAMFTFKHAYYFALFMGMIYFFFLLVLYFNIPNRLKFASSLLKITMFLLVMYNFLQLISFFNYLNSFS